MSSLNTTSPAFSVIMPVYNHAAYVADAIRSVQDQTLTDWELIAVDDGSTDGSGRIVDALAERDERITSIHQANAGPAAARNAALTHARADWLTYIDSDDLWYPHALANYADYIKGHPQAKFIYGYRHRLNEDGSKVELAGEYQDAPTGTAELWERMYLSHLCVCYRRELLGAAGNYDENLRSCEDYDLYLRISLHARFEPIGRPTGLRRRHAHNLSRQTGYSRMLEAEVLKRFADRGGGGERLDPTRVARRLARLYYAAARQHFKAACFRQCAAAARLAPGYRRTFKSSTLAVLARCLWPLSRRNGRETPKL